MKFSSSVLQDKLQALPDTTRWVVGLSGGMDSVTLLHCLLQLEAPENVLAVHVNHGLSPDALEWENHCQIICDTWHVPLVVERVKVANQGRGIEDAARQVRYEALAKHMQQGDVLLLAHHQDDQSETMLFRLMRGAGPYGLGAMDACRNFSQGYIARPLMSFSKGDLLAYAKANELEWVEDSSNTSLDFDRNFLRQAVMPLLESRWPGFGARWQNSAEACQQADQMCHDLSLLDLERCDEQKERWGYSLCFASLSLLPRYRRNNVLRNWVRLRGFEIMERKHLQETEKQLFQAAASGAAVEWGSTALRLFGERLYLTAREPMEWSRAAIAWKPADNLDLPDGSRIVVRTGSGGLKRVEGGYQIRWREGGERCQPETRQHSQTLKKLLQEYALEPWLRDRVPLIYHRDQIAAVGDLWICKGYQAIDEASAVTYQWEIPG